MSPQERTEFVQAIVELVAMIPPGRVTNYGILARAAGRPGYARMAGNILAGRYGAVSALTAHRVTASGGRLSGARAFAPGEMERLLRSEGIEVRCGKVVNYRKYLWDPIRDFIQ